MKTVKKKKERYFNSNFLLFWKGQVISAVGSQIYYMAIILWITEATDSASLLGFMGMIAGIPTIILSAIGGTFADRFSRKKILFICDSVNAIIILILAYLFYISSDNTSFLVTSVLGVAFISSILASFFTPAASAAIPDLVDAEKLTAANSFRQSAFQIATIIGWTLSSFLYVLLGIFALVIINGLTFVVAAVTKYYVKIPQKILTHENSEKGQFVKDLKNGFKHLWNRKGLRKIVFVSLLMNFFAIPVIILLPFYVKDHLEIGAHWLPIFMSVNLVGSIIGLTLAGGLKLTPQTRKNIMLIIMVFNASMTIILGFNHLVVIAIIILIISGGISGFIQVHIQTIMQLSTPEAIRGRIFGLLSTITAALSPLGMGLAGLIGDLTGKNFEIIYGVSGIILVLVSLLAVFSDDIKDFLSFNYTSVKEAVEKVNVIKEDHIEHPDQQFELFYQKTVNKKNGSIAHLNSLAMDKLKKKLKGNKK